MSTVHILVAEDDAVLREVYLKKFSMAGYDVRTVENGEEAIQAIHEKSPEILILDINMPIVDGYGVLEKFPKENRPFPVIMLTNYADEKTKSRAEELGADDYFIKSEMTIKSLLEMVENLLKAREMWNKNN